MQIRANSRHALDEIFGARSLIDNVIPVPRRNSNILFARFPLRPRKTCVSVRVKASIAPRQGAHVIRNAERNQGKEFFALRFQNRIKYALLIKNSFHFLKMQLVVNAAIVARFQTTKKFLKLECVHHALKARIELGGRARKQLFHFFRELVIRCFSKVVARIPF